MMQSTSRRSFMKAAALLTGSAVLNPLRCFGMASRKSRRPNIVFILADDLGWMDSSMYGSQYYETPNIDRLAKRGMLFTDAYAASPVCSPTRASIMTGKYPARLGITSPVCHLPPFPKDQPLINKGAAANRKMVTPHSRRFLRPEEYTVAEAFRDAGYKTGIVGKWHLGHLAEHLPGRQGFEEDMGSPNPAPPSYFSPYRLTNFPDGPKGEYVTDRVTDESLKFIDENKDKEFMLFVWHFAVHAPFQAKEEMIKYYSKKEDPRGKQKCAVMAAMIQSLDESVGRIQDKIDELKLGEDTIIIFMSDNGGNMFNSVKGEPATNNSPLRGGKGNCYEGGTRCPCIFVWPGVVEEGSKTDAVISTIDFYPTMLEMVGIKGNRSQVFDGINIVPVLKGKGKLDREAIFCYFPTYTPHTQNLPSVYVRSGDWKLIRIYGEGPERTNAYELYNLKEDIGEKHNLAEKFPEKVKELDNLIDKFLADTGAVVPIKNPSYKPAKAGWFGGGSAEVTCKDGRLIVESKGEKAFIYTNDVPIVSSDMQIKFRMRSETGGEAFLYYTNKKMKKFSPKKRVKIDAKHDGLWHEYEIDFAPRVELTGLRIDLGSSAGRFEFKGIELNRKYGELLKRWSFIF